VLVDVALPGAQKARLAKETGNRNKG